jgi:hypothetical protein
MVFLLTSDASDHRPRRGILPIDREYDMYSPDEFEFA